MKERKRSSKPPRERAPASRGAGPSLLSSLPFAVGGTLNLRLPPAWPDGGRALAWWWRAGQEISERGEVERLSDLPDYTRAANVQIWTPPADTLLTRAVLPTRARAKILQALPFALEDQLLGEPENQHFVYRTRDDGSLAVAVTARERIATWLAAVKAVGLTPVGMCPTTLLAPLPEGAWSLLVGADDSCVRTGTLSGFACAFSPERPPSVLALALKEARERDQAPRALLVTDAPADFDPAAWSAILELPVSARGLDLTQAGAPAPLNLLEREFAPASGVRLATRPLRPAAIMLGVWLVVGLGFNLWDWWQLSHANAAQRQEMLELFKRSFPQAKTVVDPALQMERNLAALQANSGRPGPNDLLPLLGRIAPAMQATPQATLRGLQYADAAVTLDLRLPDYQAVDAIKNALAARGLHAEVVSANSRDNAVDGRLRVKAGARS